MHLLPLVLPTLKIKRVKALLSQNTFSRRYDKIIFKYCLIENVLPILEKSGIFVRKLICDETFIGNIDALLSKVPNLQQIWFLEAGFKIKEDIVVNALQEIKKIVIFESSLSVSCFFIFNNYVIRLSLFSSYYHNSTCAP